MRNTILYILIILSFSFTGCDKESDVLETETDNSLKFISTKANGNFTNNSTFRFISYKINDDESLTYAGEGTYAYRSNSFFAPCLVNKDGVLTNATVNNLQGLYLPKGKYKTAMIYPAVKGTLEGDHYVYNVNLKNINNTPLIAGNIDMEVTGYDNIFNLSQYELCELRCKIKLRIEVDSKLTNNFGIDNLQVKNVGVDANFSVKTMSIVDLKTTEGVQNFGNLSSDSSGKIETKEFYILASDYSKVDKDLQPYITTRMNLRNILVNGYNRDVWIPVQVNLNRNFEPQKAYTVIIKIINLNAESYFTLTVDEWELGFDNSDDHLNMGSKWIKDHGFKIME